MWLDCFEIRDPRNEYKLCFHRFDEERQPCANTIRQKDKMLDQETKEGGPSSAYLFRVFLGSLCPIPSLALALDCNLWDGCLLTFSQRRKAQTFPYDQILDKWDKGWIIFLSLMSGFVERVWLPWLTLGKRSVFYSMAMENERKGEGGQEAISDKPFSEVSLLGV